MIGRFKYRENKEGKWGSQWKASLKEESTKDTWKHTMSQHNFENVIKRDSRTHLIWKKGKLWGLHLSRDRYREEGIECLS